MESDGIFEKRSLREMAKCRGFSSKGSGVMLWTSAGAFGTATQDKCKATHASPGPISSLIEMEHKFSVSRTKILLSRDDSWLMVHHHFLRCPCSRDWQVGPGSPKCTAEIIHSVSAASFLWCFYILRRTTSQKKKIEKALDNWTNNWCPWASEGWKLAHWWHPAINAIHYEHLGATADLRRIAFMDLNISSAFRSFP